MDSIIARELGKWNYPELNLLKPGESLTQKQLHAGMLEELWRVQAGRVVCIPPVQVETLCIGASDPGWAASAGLEEFRRDCSRGDLLCLPVHSEGPPAHWTLLVCERQNYSRPAPVCSDMQEAAVASASSSCLAAATHGCGNCGHCATGCWFCNPAKARRKEDRKNLEAALLRWQQWPELGRTDWAVRYYDSLRDPSDAAKAQAHHCLVALEGLGLPQELPERTNRRYQGPLTADCGLWVLLFVEEELRRYRGEALVRLPVTKAELRWRIDRINGILTALHEADV